MQEHQSRKRIKLGTDPIGLKRLRSVILVAHSPRTKNTRTCAASLYRCCDRAEEPEHHPLVRIFNGSGITRAPRKDLFHVINGVLKTTYNSDPTAKLGEYIGLSICYIHTARRDPAHSQFSAYKIEIIISPSYTYLALARRLATRQAPKHLPEQGASIRSHAAARGSRSST